MVDSIATPESLRNPLPIEEYERRGVMPFQEFSIDKQEEINEQCAADRPPPKWLRFELCMMRSRAFSEWHWRRGMEPVEHREKIPAYLRRAVWERDGGECQYCGAAVAHRKAHIDHVFPMSRGGKSTLANLVLACASCNLSKGAKTPEEWLS